MTFSRYFNVLLVIGLSFQMHDYTGLKFDFKSTVIFDYSKINLIPFTEKKMHLYMLKIY